MLSRSLPALAIAVVAAFPLTAKGVLSAQKAPASASTVDFARDIQPILQAHCYECHGATKSKHGLRLDLRDAALKGGESGRAIVAGDSQHSLMVRRLLGLDHEDRMPKDKDPLAKNEIALIRTWIDQGAV